MESVVIIASSLQVNPIERMHVFHLQLFMTKIPLIHGKRLKNQPLSRTCLLNLLKKGNLYHDLKPIKG